MLDTNVVVSALVFPRGPSGLIRAAWSSGTFVPLASAGTAKEIIRVLAYPKFKLSENDREQLLADYLPCTHAVRIPEPPPRTPPCRDPFDVQFLQLAVAGRASVLVTGDADLLVLAGQTRFEILTPGEFATSLA